VCLAPATSYNPLASRIGLVLRQAVCRMEAGRHVEGSVAGSAGSGFGGGSSRGDAREAVERFGVSAASVSRWRARERQHGDPRKALGGDRRSRCIEAHHDAVMAALGPDMHATIDEVRRALAGPSTRLSARARTALGESAICLVPWTA
jgi:hypothetical protein